VKEIREACEAHETCTVVFDNELSPRQVGQRRRHRGRARGRARARTRARTHPPLIARARERANERTNAAPIRARRTLPPFEESPSVGAPRTGSLRCLRPRAPCPHLPSPPHIHSHASSQLKHLENEFGGRDLSSDKPLIKVLDRTALILDIFAQRALTREGQLQVQLALQVYRAPRLTKLWTHLERQSGGNGVGLRGPGERQVRVPRASEARARKSWSCPTTSTDNRPQQRPSFALALALLLRAPTTCLSCTLPPLRTKNLLPLHAP
jgi:hypothetical protein